MSKPRNDAPLKTVRVWDPLVRVLHWTLVVSVALAGLSTWALFGAHQPAGYVALGVVVVRMVWGVIGSRHARFASFVRGPAATARYAQAVIRWHEPRFIGHNPLGAWMIVALLACVAGLGFTGWLYTTDRFWGHADVERAHKAFAWLLLGLVSTHVVGVIHASLRHRENLSGSMCHGRKPLLEPSDVS